MTRFALTLALVAALVATPSHGKQSYSACVREMSKIFDRADAKRICNPKNYVSKPNEYGWECDNPETGKLSRVKGRGARLKRDAVCE
jgi:hypothetical protein